MLHHEFIKAAEDAEAARTSAERQRLDQMAAAHEEREKALTRERAALRRGRFSLTAATGLLACVVFGATAVYNKDLLWEQYHWRAVMRPSVLTASREKEIAAKPGADFAECSNGCPRMIVAPTDKFTMGSPDNQGWPKDEGPQREVKNRHVVRGRQNRGYIC